MQAWFVLWLGLFCVGGATDSACGVVFVVFCFVCFFCWSFVFYGLVPAVVLGLFGRFSLWLRVWIFEAQGAWVTV